jgi:hypothetical protein
LREQKLQAAVIRVYFELQTIQVCPPRGKSHLN